MPSANRIIIAAAGGGKTTRIVTEAASSADLKIALITYTQNNVREIEKHCYRLRSMMPSHIEVHSWYRFLLQEMARPYRNALYDKRIEGLAWTDGRSARYARASDISSFYFSPDQLIYSDKISRFACECDTKTRGAVMRRLAQRFQHIYIDEVQDLAGYDLDLLDRILRAGIRLTLVGDHRQATYATNHAAKNSAYAGSKIVNKFREWERLGLAQLTYECESYRCHQSIIDLADMFFPEEPRTISRNATTTGHDGVFTVPRVAIGSYVACFRPQVLRLDRRSNCSGLEPTLNFGESKGMTFDRILIFPHKGAEKWLSSGNITNVEGSASKMYVGITRARYSVAFVFDGVTKVPGIQSLTRNE
jgi:DNA helicase-2/ATP-dependent DNA helicase PcrA